jgi:hypothetical protein
MRSYNSFLDEAVAAAGLARLAAKGKLASAEAQMAANGLKAAPGAPKTSSALAIRKPKALPGGKGGAIVKPKPKALPGSDGGKLARVNKTPGSIVRTSTTPDKKPSSVPDEKQSGNKPGTSRRPSDWGTKPDGDWESGSGSKERKPFKFRKPSLGKIPTKDGPEEAKGQDIKNLKYRNTGFES